MTAGWTKLNSGTQAFNPTLADSYQVSKVLVECAGALITTYETYRVTDQGLLFLSAADTFAEAKSLIDEDMDNHD